ncbi:hypothetical protein [Streptomyces sp. NBC_00239]|uniref:hypothetical protein n=1 Tax=Streptomyces sp. NBC_00239 TaxID=2903640 RepID=UPI002E2D82A5|nr:hypothetical protein [Streptomyces sp. NBC_00239]
MWQLVSPPAQTEAGQSLYLTAVVPGSAAVAGMVGALSAGGRQHDGDLPEHGSLAASSPADEQRIARSSGVFHISDGRPPTAGPRRSGPRR